MKIENILKEVPQWQTVESLRYENLNGGYSNTIYKIFADDKAYALRINGKQSTYLGLRPEDEPDIIVQAALYDITPNALVCPNKKDYLITEFVEGEMMPMEKIREEETLQKVVELLKRLHAIPYSGDRTSTQFSLTRGYLQGAKSLGIDYSSKLAEFLTRMEAIEEMRQKDPAYLRHYCHNDAFTHNMMLDKNGNVKLIDWELSGLGDIWFDLATVSFSCGFSKEEDELMLRYYFTDFDDQKMQTLHDIKFVCMIREIAWALLTTALNTQNGRKGKSYLDFADTVLDRMKRGLVSLI